MSTFHGSLWGNKHGDTRFFFPAFSKNNLIKNIFEKEKNFDNRTCLFLENSSALGVFWLRRGLQANHGTVRKSAKSPQPGNQKQVKWSNTVYCNKRSFKFKIKFCVFQVTNAKFCMKVIRIFNAQPVKILILRARWRVNKHGDPIFYCIFLLFISWMLIVPSFKKSLIVEQFQGNYLKLQCSFPSLWNMEETSEELPNFSIGTSLLGPFPTSNKNEAEKNSQVARFANLSEDELQQILAERHSLGTIKVIDWSLTKFKGKISAFIVVFKFIQPGE